MNLAIFIFGLLLAIFALPKVSGFIMTRLMNENFITSRIIKPEKAELIRYAGPRLSVFAIGIILMIISIILTTQN